jgi:hypothetical protein
VNTELRDPRLRMAALVTLAVVWAASRVWLLGLLAGRQAWVNGDIAYFAQSLGSFDARGLAHTLVEYPVPAVAVLGLPFSVADGDPERFRVLFHALAVLTDLVFTTALWWSTRRRPLLPLLAWVLAVPLLGVTAYARFDLLPGVLCGLAVLCLPRRPVPAAVLASVATGIKLWPALVLPALLGVRRTRPRVVTAIVATGLVLAGASVALAGVGRLVSPLTYQVDRGLQIESLFATPAMLAWGLRRHMWHVGYAASKSYEITGPGVSALLLLSTVASAAYLLALVTVWVRLVRLARRRVDVSLHTSLWVALASICGFVVVGKVFSPQYLLWLLPPAIAGLAVASSRGLRLWTAGLLGAALLTQLVFPTGYTVLLNHLPRVLPVLLVLALRNLLMAGLFVVAAVHTWKGLRAADPADDSAGKGAGSPAAAS